MNDPVNHPSHYTHGEIECIDAIRAALGPAGFIAYCRGSQIKYNWRTGHKDDPAQEQAKAAWYAKRAEETIKANPDTRHRATAAEQERDELRNKLAVALAQLEERDAQVSKLYDAKVKTERERNAALKAQRDAHQACEHFLWLLKAALVKLHTLEVPRGYSGAGVAVVEEVDPGGTTCHLRIVERGGAR